MWCYSVALMRQNGTVFFHPMYCFTVRRAESSRSLVVLVSGLFDLARKWGYCYKVSCGKQLICVQPQMVFNSVLELLKMKFSFVFKKAMPFFFLFFLFQSLIATQIRTSIYKYQSAFNFATGWMDFQVITGPGNLPPMHESPTTRNSHEYHNMTERDNQGGLSIQWFKKKKRLLDPSWWGWSPGMGCKTLMSGYVLHNVKGLRPLLTFSSPHIQAKYK